MRIGLSIGSRALREIVEACERARPLEACGLLGGVAGGPCGEVHGIVALPNERAARDAFFISPRAIAGARSAFVRRGQRIIGCYHSHPTAPATPSSEDCAAMRRSRLFWLIHGEGGVRVFRWNGFRVDAVPLLVGA